MSGSVSSLPPLRTGSLHSAPSSARLGTGVLPSHTSSTTSFPALSSRNSSRMVVSVDHTFRSRKIAQAQAAQLQEKQLRSSSQTSSTSSLYNSHTASSAAKQTIKGGSKGNATVTSFGSGFAKPAGANQSPITSGRQKYKDKLNDKVAYSHHPAIEDGEELDANGIFHFSSHLSFASPSCIISFSNNSTNGSSSHADDSSDHSVTRIRAQKKQQEWQSMYRLYKQAKQHKLQAQQAQFQHGTQTQSEEEDPTDIDYNLDLSHFSRAAHTHTHTQSHPSIAHGAGTVEEKNDAEKKEWFHARFSYPVVYDPQGNISTQQRTLPHHQASNASLASVQSTASISSQTAVAGRNTNLNSMSQLHSNHSQANFPLSSSSSITSITSSLPPVNPHIDAESIRRLHRVEIEDEKEPTHV